jgi:hypothetical protein
MEHPKECLVIMVKNRFYHNHTPTRITTAWSLSGAKLFLNDNHTKKVLVELLKKGYKPIVKKIQIVDYIKEIN